MISPKINILCAIDNSYAPYCGIMLTSLFENNKDCHFVVYVFEDGSVTETNVKKYQRLSKKYGNEIVFRTIEGSLVDGFPVRKGANITIPTYYRLLAANLLPDNVHKVVYLDCDTLVVDDIKPLWEVDTTNVAIAGVRDHYLSRGKDWRPNTPYDYINAGVLVMNLDYWRRNGVYSRIFDYIQMNRDDETKLFYMDQDTLNAVLNENKKVLPERFNFQVEMFVKEFWHSFSKDQQNEFVEEGKHVLVIHYLGVKPWKGHKYFGPFFYEWEKMRRKSLWPCCRPHVPWHKQIKLVIKRLFFKTLIRKQVQEIWFSPAELQLFS